MRRILTGFGTLLFVIVFNFLLFRLLPGDPIGMLTRGKDVDAETLAELRAQFNGSVLEQFWRYLHDPLSTSQVTLADVPVWTEIGAAWWPTVLLLGVSTVASASIGIWLGIRAGWGRGGRFDQNVTGTTLTLYFDARILARHAAADLPVDRSRPLPRGCSPAAE